jgi:hypothetical protein
VLFTFLLAFLPFCLNKPFLLQWSIKGFCWFFFLVSMLFLLNLSISVSYILQWTFLHFCFSKLFYFSNPFCFSGPVWCFKVLCWSSFLLCLFSSIFNEPVCLSAPTCFNEAFYLSMSINLFASLSCGLLGSYVGFLFYSNVVLSGPLCFNDLFFASNNLSTFLFCELLWFNGLWYFMF